MKILIIKLSAFGDVVQAIPAFQSVRRHYPDADIDLLTAPLFADFTEKLGLFNRIIPHQRFKYYHWKKIKQLRSLIKGQYDYVIDLQCIGRTANYFYFCCPKPPIWAGVAKYASVSYRRKFLETLKPYERHQLLLDGLQIPYQFETDNDWVDTLSQDVSSGIKEKYVLLVAGASPKHPKKCWSYQHYAEIAMMLARDGIIPVLIGGQAEMAVAEKMIEICPEIHNLVGKTTLHDIAVLAKKAYYALGNDTGAMHLIGQMGTGCLVLFSGKNDPFLCKPQYKNCDFIQVQDLTNNELTVSMVAEKLAGIILH